MHAFDGKKVLYLQGHQFKSYIAFMKCTHELKNLHISAMAYYINTLDGERSVHGRCEPKCFKDGDLF